MDTKTNKKSRRNIHIHFCATEDEATLIRQRKIDSCMVSLSAYIRKMAINGYHINLDLTDIREMVRLLSNVTNNTTQLSRRANEIQVLTLMMLKTYTRNIIRCGMRLMEL